MVYYQLENNDNSVTRIFSPDIKSEELVWHRDKEDRIVEVLQSDGWEFQMDDELPIELKKGMVLTIPKETYHRIKRGSNDLIIKIIFS